MEKINRGRRGARSKFDEAFKRKAVLEYHRGEGTLYSLGSKYGVSHTTIHSWIVAYEKQQEQLVTLAAMEAENTGVTEPANDSSQAPSASEVKALQKELHLARVKLACLETLIDITERDLGIDIRKNAGTRSSAE